MSFDPFGSGSDLPPEYGPVPMQSTDSSAARSRVLAPAIALIVAGVLNLLFALYMMVNSLITTALPAENLKAKQMALYEMLPPAMRENAESKTADEMKSQAMLVDWPLTLLALLASILPIAGGIRMRSLKSYGLSMCGAISAAIPCMSCMACCGLGEIVGIWAIVVLLDPEVRAAFP